MSEAVREAAAMAIVVTALVGVAIGRCPRLHMNRATIALVGATALVAIGAIPLDEALARVDLDTLALLLGLMIINANMRAAGFFSRIAGFLATRARTPRMLLAVVMGCSGVLSALFLNDTIVLAFTPIVLDLALALALNPVPYLAGLVMAANIGSVATLIGNPQNMLIGTSSGIGYVAFSARLLPIAALGLVAAFAVVALVYRRDLAPRPLATPPAAEPASHPELLGKTLLSTGALLAMLVGGVAPPLAALAAASLLLVTRRLAPERVFAEIDWSLLVFFAGLFVVVGTLERTPLLDGLDALAAPAIDYGTGALTALAAVTSNLVSNVPAVLLFRPAVGALAEPEPAWLTLAMATTFAGNLTLLGSVANLIVAEIARRRGTHLGFVEYLRAGVPTTLATLALGAAWLALFRP